MHSCDVLVIGGGPAGSTVSALLAEQGHDVVLLEKDVHPRFHIGESLLPMGVPIFKRLGVMEKIEEIGVRKYGVDFTYHKSRYPTKTGSFETARLPDGLKYAFHVRRDQFDHVLLQNAEQKGVRVLQNTAVVDVELVDDEIRSVTSRSADNEKQVWTPRFVVDASGRDTLMSRKLGTKYANPRHKTAALYAHFDGAVRRTGVDAGNISLYWFEHGWIWLIPLPNGVMSVGAVCTPDYLKSRKNSLEDFFLDTIRLAPDAFARLANATLVSDVTATGNYSYLSNKAYGKNYALVGDSFVFLDPVLSTGVMVAMKSGEAAAPLIHRYLEGEHNAAALFEPYQQWILTAVERFSWFIYRWNCPIFRRMWLSTGKSHESEAGARMTTAVASLLAGNMFEDNETTKALKQFQRMYHLLKAFNVTARYTGLAFILRKFLVRPGTPAKLQSS